MSKAAAMNRLLLVGEGEGECKSIGRVIGRLEFLFSSKKCEVVKYQPSGEGGTRSKSY